MQPEQKTWMYDMLRAIEEVEQFLIDVDFDNYQHDIKTKRAVERDLGIIGEAMNRLLQNDAQIFLSNSRKIVDTRHRIIHGYDTVSDEIVWNIVTQHLPVLKHELTILIEG